MSKYSRLDFKTALPQIEGDVNVIQEWISSALDFFYPPGTIYETSNADFNPNKVWGGTWEKIEGRVLVGYDEDDTDFDTTGEQGGSKGAWRHTHEINFPTQNGDAWGYYGGGGYGGWGVSGSGNNNNWGRQSNKENGSLNNTLDADKANMPPYEVVVIWKRIS